MLCPKCNETMQTVTYADIDVERLRRDAMGYGFDMLEREHLAAIEGSEAIDIGSAKTGERFKPDRRYQMSSLPWCHAKDGRCPATTHLVRGLPELLWGVFRRG